MATFLALRPALHPCCVRGRVSPNSSYHSQNTDRSGAVVFGLSLVFSPKRSPRNDSAITSALDWSWSRDRIPFRPNRNRRRYFSDPTAFVFAGGVDSHRGRGVRPIYSSEIGRWFDRLYLERQAGSKIRLD